MENVVIIGGGPAGLAAGLYLARASLNPLIYAGSPPGGQLTLTSEVENYPGFDSVLGATLIEKMRAQVIKFGGRIVDENVQKIKFDKSPFQVGANHDSPVQQAKSVIIATGAKAMWLGVPGEERLRGKGVSACATCDGFFFKNKVVGVVGGGDTAMEEALTLTKFAKHVIIIHRKGEFRASKIMQERVLKHPKIEVVWNAAVEEVMGEKKVEEIRLKILDPRLQILDKKNTHIQHPVSNIYHLKLDGLFIAIGHKPDTDLFKGKVEVDEKGYIITNSMAAIRILRVEGRKSRMDIENGRLKFDFSYQTMTSVKGVFAVGDCVDYVYKQAATAAGMGVAGGLDCEKYLEGV